MSRLPIAAAAVFTVLTLVTLSVASASSKTPGRTTVSNTSLPSISGSAVVGSTLQASSGTWSGHGMSYSFQWNRCSGATCSAIPGATGSSYLIAPADSGDRLQVTVTAKGRSGSATANSAQTGVVTSATPATYTNTGLPAISGTAEVGQTLTVSNGSWSPTSPSFQYSWQRCQNGSCSASPTNANKASYSVQAADAGYTIVAEVAPAGNWSQAANSNPSATVTAPSNPSGAVDFDGRASSMSTLYSYETTPGNISTLQHGQSPSTWSCLCFLKNDLSLVSDGTFGKAYKAAVATGDTNPWGGSSTNDGAAQVSLLRNNDLGQTQWFGFAVRVDSWSGPLTDQLFTTLLSLGYQTAEGDQVGLGLINNKGQLSFEIHSNAGYADDPTGWATTSTQYKDPILPVTFGQWEEFVVGVKWATDNTGFVQVYNRTPGGTWSQIFDMENAATYLYGTTQYGTFAKDGSNWPQVIDKIGLYFGEAGKESETAYESGLTRSSDLATAESTLP